MRNIRIAHLSYSANCRKESRGLPKLKDLEMTLRVLLRVACCIVVADADGDVGYGDMVCFADCAVLLD
jgi:hypothetical protein